MCVNDDIQDLTVERIGQSEIYGNRLISMA